MCNWIGKGVETVLELIWRTYSRVVWKVWEWYDGLGWARRVWDRVGGLSVGVKGQRIMWRPRIGMEGLTWV